MLPALLEQKNCLICSIANTQKISFYNILRQDVVHKDFVEMLIGEFTEKPAILVVVEANLFCFMVNNQFMEIFTVSRHS